MNMRFVALMVGVLLWPGVFPELGRADIQIHGGWPEGVTPVLRAQDVTVYRKLFENARRGQKPDAALVRQLKDESLMPHVEARYYLSSDSRISYTDLNRWLRDHRDLPQARTLYELAQDRRPAAPQECKTVKRTVKIKNKQTGKLESKTRNKRVCETVGSRPALPPMPLALIAQQERRNRLEAAREAEYAGLAPAVAARRRELLGGVWRARSRGDYAEAFSTLTGPDARRVIGDTRWQSEVVKIAQWHEGKKNYSTARTVALRAAQVPGPERDTALWLAGMASYRLGNRADAAQSWQTLAQEEPVKGIYYARAAWWGARAFRELGNTRAANAMLQQAGRDPLSFYGQLANAQLGVTRRVDFTPPGVRRQDMDQLTRVPAVRRALGLAQVGEVALAQDEIKAAYEDVPYQASKSLAALGISLHMPATALYVGKDLLQRGETVPAALYPEPNQWHPSGRKLVDRSLMLAIMRQESAFQPAVGSRVGAQGLMQLMPATSKYIARLAGRPIPDRNDLHDPAINMTLAQDYLNYLNNKLNGNLILVVAAYNGGVGNVQRWLSRGVTPGDDPMMFIESIPFDETKDYVEKVMANLWLYQERLGQTPESRAALAQGYWPLKFADRYDRVRKVS